MAKKLILLVAVLGLGAGGFFYWWNNQADVRELNKTLPAGVKVVKSLWGEEYKVVNKIDGYEFKVPNNLNGWDRIQEVKYNDVTYDEEIGYSPHMLDNLKKIISRETIFVIDGEMPLDFIPIRYFHLNEDIELPNFIQKFKDTFDPDIRKETKNNWIEIYSTLEEEIMGGYNVSTLSRFTRTSTRPEPNMSGTVYFFKNQLHIFMMEYDWGKELIANVVANGKW